MLTIRAENTSFDLEWMLSPACTFYLQTIPFHDLTKLIESKHIGVPSRFVLKWTPASLFFVGPTVFFLFDVPILP